MKLKFTKMHGAGNDFVVIDAISQAIDFSTEQWRHLGDRRFGVGADQILVVERPTEPSCDFRYRIFNGDGSEVEQCGNGSRAFVRFVSEKGLTTKRSIRVQTMAGIIEPRLEDEGRDTLWPLEVRQGIVETTVLVSVVSMGNPHAVQVVDDADTAPVAELGPQVEHHPRFPKRVNAGFMQVVNRHHIKLRVYERGAGETLACGTGACAAVVAGIRRGLLDSPVRVSARGGELSIAWDGEGKPVYLSGPAVTVYEGEIEL
jgi:diaminopimelate epimerase